MRIRSNVKISRLGVTGDEFFINRHVGLVDGLRDNLPIVDLIPTGTHFRTTLRGRMRSAVIQLLYRRRGDGGRWLTLLLKTPDAFTNLSIEAESIVRAQPQIPDHILHLHAMYAPFTPGSSPLIPYSLITDYTGAQCRNWPLWLPPASRATSILRRRSAVSPPNWSSPSAALR